MQGLESRWLHKLLQNKTKNNIMNTCRLDLFYKDTKVIKIGQNTKHTNYRLENQL